MKSENGSECCIDHQQTVSVMPEEGEEMPKPSASEVELIEAIEDVNAETTIPEMDSLVLQVGTRIRNKVPIPPSKSIYQRWEWVLFEIHRSLKSEIKDLKKEIRNIRSGQ